MKNLLIASASAFLVSCAAGGYKSPGSHDLPNNSVGPFRLLDDQESSGGVAVAASGLVDSGMALFVDATNIAFVFSNAQTGTRTTTDATSPWLAGFGPREIRRSATTTAAHPTFTDGTTLLTAAETWEGTEVFDPWMIKLSNGTFRLYYAAEGGIGAAESSSFDGTFTRVSGAPFFTGTNVGFANGATPKHPSVIFDGTRYVMYFQVGTRLGVSFSTDGLTWDTAAQTDLGYTVPEDSEKQLTGYGTPAVVWMTPTVGEPFAHIFAEALYDDGTRGLLVSGSYNHTAFETAALLAIGKGKNQGAPAPLALDGRKTMLYFAVDATLGMAPSRNMFTSTTPGNERFPLATAQTQ